jgi:hypothetical protein
MGVRVGLSILGRLLKMNSPTMVKDMNAIRKLGIEALIKHPRHEC